MTLFRPNLSERYFAPNGQPTLDGLKLLQGMHDEIVTLQNKLDAIAAVTAPSGGATVDSEARAAINAIISGAS